MREATAPVPETEPARSLMTLRVSRDGGRTWGRRKRFYARDCDPLPDTIALPPCRCPRCRGRGQKS